MESGLSDLYMGFTWVLGPELKPSGLYVKCLSLLRHLTIPGSTLYASLILIHSYLCVPRFTLLCSPLPKPPPGHHSAVSQMSLCLPLHREDPGTLCCGSEQIGHPGAGLPHAIPPLHPGGGHQESQGSPWHHPQPGILEAAPSPGPEAAAGSGGMREGKSGQVPGWFPGSRLGRGDPGGRR